MQRGLLRRELARLGPARAGVATLLVGGDYPSEVYQRRIDRLARDLGLASRPERLPGDATLGQVIGKVAELDADPDVSGILVLRPIPSHLPEARIYAALPPEKDVEAVHPTNAGLLALGTPPAACPSTPRGPTCSSSPPGSRA